MQTQWNNRNIEFLENHFMFWKIIIVMMVIIKCKQTSERNNLLKPCFICMFLSYYFWLWLLIIIIIARNVMASGFFPFVSHKTIILQLNQNRKNLCDIFSLSLCILCVVKFSTFKETEFIFLATHWNGRKKIMNIKIMKANDDDGNDERIKRIFFWNIKSKKMKNNVFFLIFYTKKNFIKWIQINQ